jgi:hypothetical protein
MPMRALLAASQLYIVHGLINAPEDALEQSPPRVLPWLQLKQLIRTLLEVLATCSRELTSGYYTQSP